jgi:hypothetical protein
MLSEVASQRGLEVSMADELGRQLEVPDGIVYRARGLGYVWNSRSSKQVVPVRGTEQAYGDAFEP